MGLLYVCVAEALDRDCVASFPPMSGFHKLSCMCACLVATAFREGASSSINLSLPNALRRLYFRESRFLAYTFLLPPVPTVLMTTRVSGKIKLDLSRGDGGAGLRTDSTSWQDPSTSSLLIHNQAGPCAIGQKSTSSMLCYLRGKRAKNNVALGEEWGLVQTILCSKRAAAGSTGKAPHLLSWEADRLPP